jgi:hypothetical protein
MNMVKMTAALVLLPAIAFADPDLDMQKHAKYYEALGNITEMGVNVNDDVVALAACGDNPECLFEGISPEGYGCLLDNLANVIVYAGEYDAATWPTPVDGLQIASFDITSELPFSAGDIDPEDYLGNYQITVNYSSASENMLGEIIVKPVNADDDFMWFMVNFAYNGGFFGRQFPNCSEM